MLCQKVGDFKTLTMKLYTKEQVRQAMSKKLEFPNDDIEKFYSDDEIIDSLKPIELPSDDEIKNKVNEISWIHPYYTKGFFSGIKFIKEQILNQNK